VLGTTNESRLDHGLGRQSLLGLDDPRLGLGARVPYLIFSLHACLRPPAGVHWEPPYRAACSADAGRLLLLELLGAGERPSLGAALSGGFFSPAPGLSPEILCVLLHQVLPFVDHDNPLQAYFPPPRLAILFPVLFMVVSGISIAPVPACTIMWLCVSVVTCCCCGTQAP